MMTVKSPAVDYPRFPFTRLPRWSRSDFGVRGLARAFLRPGLPGRRSSTESFAAKSFCWGTWVGPANMILLSMVLPAWFCAQRREIFLLRALRVLRGETRLPPFPRFQVEDKQRSHHEGHEEHEGRSAKSFCWRVAGRQQRRNGSAANGSARPPRSSASPSTLLRACRLCGKELPLLA